MVAIIVFCILYFVLRAVYLHERRKTNDDQRTTTDVPIVVIDERRSTFVDARTINVFADFREYVVRFPCGWYGHPNTLVDHVEDAYRYTKKEAEELTSNMGGEIQKLKRLD